MMFAVCDPGLNRETHVTLILRWLCGLSPKEIGQAFLVVLRPSTGGCTGGVAGCASWAGWPDVDDLPDIGARRDSADRCICCSTWATTAAETARPGTSVPVRGALRLTEQWWTSRRRRIRTRTPSPRCSASTPLAATRLTSTGVRPRRGPGPKPPDRARIERGLMHLGRSATGESHVPVASGGRHRLRARDSRRRSRRPTGTGSWALYQVLAPTVWQPDRGAEPCAGGGRTGRHRRGTPRNDRPHAGSGSCPDIFVLGGRADLERRAAATTAAARSPSGPYHSGGAGRAGVLRAADREHGNLLAPFSHW